MCVLSLCCVSGKPFRVVDGERVTQRSHTGPGSAAAMRSDRYLPLSRPLLSRSSPFCGVLLSFVLSTVSHAVDLFLTQWICFSPSGFVSHAVSCLAGACLVDAQLMKADLTGSNLSSALLNGANLDSAILSKCQMTNAQLQKACLDRAQLVHADLTAANLREASLCVCSLESATLERAQLQVSPPSSWASSTRSFSFSSVSARRLSLFLSISSHILTISCTYYDEIKGFQDLRSILMLIL